MAKMMPRYAFHRLFAGLASSSARVAVIAVAAALVFRNAIFWSRVRCSIRRDTRCVEVILFYLSHADEGLRNQLEKHLSALKHQGLLETWHDRRITVGQVFNAEIDAHLEAAEVILLLISSDFLASDYCYKREMARAMERHEARDAIVIPVILRPCDWQDTPFGKLMAAPKDGLAVTKWPDIDDAFLDVVTAIKGALRSRGSRPNAEKATTRTRTPVAVPVVRSSNLRVKKEFTDYERDRFQKDGFEYLASFFENSLGELVRRNPGLDREFRRIDANRFNAAVYKSGKKVSQCTVYIGGMPRGIAYSHSDDVGSNSFNEILSVETDEQSIYFEPLGMSTFDSREKKLSFEGAAEAYWALFLEPIQPRD